jgi:peptidoglycan glycosyltransferase
VNKQIRRLAVAFLVLFILLFVQINYLQVFAAKRLADNPHNQRHILQEYAIERGAILARDERTVLAYSKATNGMLKYLRVYPNGPLFASLTGFSSVLFGNAQLEATENSFLSGQASALAPQTFVDQLLGRPVLGATVVTTIDPRLQRAAARALGSLPGAVVALDPRSGDILAMYANPTYDPNPLASHDSAVARAAQARLVTNPEKPLLSRASQELFPPGSTFKMVTAAAALENGITPNTLFPNPPQLNLPQTNHALQNFGGEHCLGGAPQITLAQAFQVSCNVVFGQVGLKIGANALVTQAQKFGFDGSVPFQLPWAEGQIPQAGDFAQALPALAFSAIGQEDVLANPLQMALVAGAVANHGIEMAPRVISEIRDPSGRVVQKVDPVQYGEPISVATASELTAMMVSVVQAGTGTAAQIPGITVAGKTGTAQTASGSPHAWFVCFAPAEHPQIVVAVVVLNGGSLGSEATGGHVAAPIARAVLEAALRG